MVALDSTATSKPSAPSFSLLRGAAALLRGWHLSSLDAPTVAMTWCAAFSSVVGVPLTRPAGRWPVLFLCLATWLCYVGDRTQDARAAREASELRARHHFYGRWWRTQRGSLVTLVGMAALACATTGVLGLSLPLLFDYGALTLAALLYFAWVHSGRERGARVLAKEAVVAVIFALGCILPAWSSASTAVRAQLAPAGLLFALLCWLNCVAIERWEGFGIVSVRAHPSTRWAARHLSALSIGSALAAVALACLRHALGRPTLLAPYLAAAFLLLAALERFRQRLSVDSLRVFADLALLTPLVWFVAKISG
ncbi:MAG TPA: hypothetical protein VFK05_14060 [Polyangiaceae bacterium]|nr:hypothetical protein [Polyangiaceae bacterium]